MSQLEAEAIGARIARARKEAGLTQEQVGDLASFSKRSLQDYEAGTTVPYKHLREISALFNRPVEWFLHGEPEAPSQDDLAQLRAEVAGLAETLARIERLLDEEAEG